MNAPRCRGAHAKDGEIRPFDLRQTGRAAGIFLQPAQVQGPRGIRSARGVVVLEDRVPRPVEVVELAALQGAPEHPADQKYDGDGERDEEGEAFHVSMPAAPRATRSAFNTTTNELVAMPTAASQGPIQPAAASGSASAL